MRNSCRSFPTTGSIRLYGLFALPGNRPSLREYSVWSPMYPVAGVEGKSITVSSLAVNFGANVKGKLASSVLFDIIKSNGNAIRTTGWTQVRRFVPLRFQAPGVMYPSLQNSLKPVQSFDAPDQNASDRGFLGWCFHHTFTRKPCSESADTTSNGDEK